MKNNEQSSHIGLLMFFSIIMLIFGSVNITEAGACWIKRLPNGKCNVIYSRHISKEECCKPGNDDFAFTDKDLSEAEYFLATAIGDGTACSSCIDSCDSFKCSLGKRCVLKKGRPKCICSPVCKTASKEKRKFHSNIKSFDHHESNVESQLFGAHKTNLSHSKSVKLPVRRSSNISILRSSNKKNLFGDIDEREKIRLNNFNENITSSRKKRMVFYGIKREELKNNESIVTHTTNSNDDVYKQKIFSMNKNFRLTNLNNDGLNLTTDQMPNKNYKNNENSSILPYEDSKFIILKNATAFAIENNKKRSFNNKTVYPIKLIQNQKQFQQRKELKSIKLSTDANINDKNENYKGDMVGNDLHHHPIYRINRNKHNCKQNKKSNNNYYKNRHFGKNYRSKNKCKGNRKNYLSDHPSNFGQLIRTTKYLKPYTNKICSQNNYVQFSLNNQSVMLHKIEKLINTSKNQIDHQTPEKSVFNFKCNSLHLEIKNEKDNIAIFSQEQKLFAVNKEKLIQIEKKHKNDSGHFNYNIRSEKNFPGRLKLKMNSNKQNQQQYKRKQYQHSNDNDSLTKIQNNLHLLNANIKVNLDDKIRNDFIVNGFSFPQIGEHTMHFVNPVCGTDGRTYRSECQLKKRACRQNSSTLTIAYRGYCQTSCKNVKCHLNLTCVEDQYGLPHCIKCSFNCKNRSEGNKSALICGYDGQTYDNICQLNRQICLTGRSVGVAYNGPCIAGSSCETISCGPRRTCLKDLATNQPRCVTCSFKCPKDKKNKNHASARIIQNDNSDRIKICGNNNHTYYSWCHMRRDSCNTDLYIDIKHIGHCHKDSTSGPDSKEIIKNQ